MAIKKFWADDRFQKAVEAKAQLLTAALEEMAGLLPGTRLKGRGMMQGLDMGSGTLAAIICDRAFEKGLIIETSGNEDQVIKVLAPLTTDDDTFLKGLTILRGAIRTATDSSKFAAE